MNNKLNKFEYMLKIIRLNINDPITGKIDLCLLGFSLAISIKIACMLILFFNA